jgi:type VI secretion system protein ImpA
MDQATLDRLEALLAPVSPEWPSGENLTDSALFREIKEARRADDPGLSQGSWQTELKVSEWSKVSLMCDKAISTRSKDLRLATWYTESLTHQEGFAGAAFGLRLIAGMLDRFWETLHPQAEDGDLEERIGKIEWLNTQLGQTLRQVPITAPQHGSYNWYLWKESRDVENRKLLADGGAAHKQALADGKLGGDVFDKGVRDSGFLWFQKLIGELSEARDAYELLDKKLDEHFGISGPSLGELRAALEECDEVVRRISGYNPARSAAVVRSAEGDASGGGNAASGNAEVSVSASASGNGSGNGNGSASVSTGASAPSSSPKAETATVAAAPKAFSVEPGSIRNRGDAVLCLYEVARYFRTNEPHSPVAALAERAASWAEMSLDQWLQAVIKDEATLNGLRDLLNLKL